MTENLKIPPSDMDAERAILGIVIVDNKKAWDVISSLKEEEFYYRANQIIFRTICEMKTSNSKAAIDFLTVKDCLQKNKQLKDVGGIKYIATLADDLTSTANLGYYIKIVKDKYVLRQLIVLGNEITNRAFEGKVSPDEITDKIQSNLLDFRFEDKRPAVLTSHNIEQEIENVKELYENPETYGGISSGFPNYDEMFGKFKNQQYILVAGRPSMGKTSFMLSTANYQARKGKKVLFFSLEQSFKAIIHRLLSATSKVPLKVFNQTGTDDQKIINKIKFAVSVFKKCEFYINDNSLSIDQLTSLAIKYKNMYDIDIIYLDYAQLIGIDRHYRVNNRAEEMTLVSKKLKGLAKDLDVPLIAASSLSRSIEKRSNKRPRLSDLRDSGSLEFDSDVVIFLYNKDLYDKEDEEFDPNIIEMAKKGNIYVDLIIEKNRDSATGETKVVFEKKFTRFISNGN